MVGAIRRLAGRAAAAPDHQIVLAFAAFAALCEGLHISSPDRGVADAAESLSLAAAFVVAGLLARRRQPDNRTGALLMLVGFALLAEDLQTSDDRFWLTIGSFLSDASGPALLWLLLAFPSGRLGSALERWLVISLAVTLAVVQKNQAGVLGPYCPSCSSSYLSIRDWIEPIVGPLNSGLHQASRVIVTGILCSVALILIQRWRASSRPARRVLSPFLAVAALVGVTSVAATTVASGGTPANGPVLGAVYVSSLLLPFAFLAGLVRLELARIDVVQAVMSLGPGRRLADLRATASRALGDPLLRVLRREGPTLKDEAERVVVPPEGLATTDLTHQGRQVGLLVHDPALRQDRRLLETVTGVLGEALDKERRALEAERQAEEVRRARERLRAAAEEERRRIERDLHDGAQQRIAAAALWLGVLESRVTAGDAAGGQEVIARLSHELDAAIEELRSLAHGSLPGVLVDEGLDAALRALAERTPIAVKVAGSAGDGVPPAVSAAAYFAVAEGLTNAIRHSGAEAIEVAVDRRNGVLGLEVRDDGRGGADIESGSGLKGLAGRLQARGGRLEVDSPSGAGTVLRIELPVRAEAG